MWPPLVSAACFLLTRTLVRSVSPAKETETDITKYLLAPATLLATAAFTIANALLAPGQLLVATGIFVVVTFLDNKIKLTDKLSDVPSSLVSYAGSVINLCKQSFDHLIGKKAVEHSTSDQNVNLSGADENRDDSASTDTP